MAVGPGDSRVSWHVTGREGVGVRVGWGDGEGTGPATREQGRSLCPLYRSSPCFLPGQICKGSMHWRPYLLLQSCPIQECHRRAKGAHHWTFVPKWVTRITCGQNNYLCYSHDSNFTPALHWTNLFDFLQLFTLFLALLFGSSSVDSDLPLIRFCLANLDRRYASLHEISACYTVPCNSQSPLQHCRKFLPSSVKAAGFCRSVNEILSFDTGCVVEMPRPSSLVVVLLVVPLTQLTHSLTARWPCYPFHYGRQRFCHRPVYNIWHSAERCERILHWRTAFLPATFYSCTALGGSFCPTNTMLSVPLPSPLLCSHSVTMPVMGVNW